MKKRSIILSIGGVGICSLAALESPVAKLQSVSLVATLLSAVATVITMILAVLLYNRFGVEQDVLKRQLEAVNSLLATLGKMRFAMTTVNDKMTVRITPFDPFVHQLESHYGKVLVFNADAARQLETLSSHSVDIYLPIPIAKSLRPLVPSIRYPIAHQDTRLSDAMHFVPRVTDGEDDTFFIPYNDAEMTLMDFLSLWSELIDGIDLWFQQNTSNAPGLNIPHLTKEDP